MISNNDIAEYTGNSNNGYFWVGKMKENTMTCYDAGL